MKKYVSYYRVSTDRQGKTKLGLGAQREAIMRHIEFGGSLAAEFTEVESARSHKNRPQLAQALEYCKKNRATLIIAKLDRLGRNVAFISELMESGVDFVCCDNPHATKLVLHIMAAFAEHEREIISQRTKEALARVRAELKQNGSRTSLSGKMYTKLGGPDPLAALAKANAARQLRPPARHVLDLMADLRDAGRAYGLIAAELDSRDIRTPQGNRWYASTVRAALLRASVDERKDAMAHALYEDVALERNDALAHSFSLQGLEIGTIPPITGSNAPREPIKGGMPMPSNIAEAQRMLDIFTSVGARSFVVTKLTVDQQIIWGKPYSAVELREKLPAMVRTAAEQKPFSLPGGKLVSAGENLIVRPSGPDVIFVQLDDVGADQLERVRPASCIIVNTSPGNFQAWMAVSGVGKAESKEFVRRVRKAVGDVDKSASGAVRVAGTSNFKVKYWPAYPNVTITHAMPGRMMTAEELQDMGLLAEPEPTKFATDTNVGHNAPARVSRDGIHPWPSYDICLMRARKKRDGSPDRSHADLSFAMIAITGGHSIEDTAAKLAEVSEKARKNIQRGDTGYPMVTARNAADFVERNRGRTRA